jgi:hypothetical protein
MEITLGIPASTMIHKKNYLEKRAEWRRRNPPTA